MIEDNWMKTADTTSYWRIDPNSEHIRWQVSYWQANTLGSVAGQIIQTEGWYWCTADWKGNRFSSMVGPFSSASAAMADCETVHKAER